MSKRKEQLEFLKNISSSNRTSNNLARTGLTAFVMLGGIGLIWFFGWQYSKSGEEDAYEKVFNTLIPLIASWIGTVLAFYYGRENMEAAADRFLPLGKEALIDVPVKNIMIDLDTMVFEDDIPNSNNKLILEELRDKYNANRKNRIPFLTKDKLAPQYIIQTDVIQRFLDENSNNTNLKSLNVDDLISSEGYKNRFGLEEPNGFVVVGPKTRVETAIEELNKIDDGKDIFVTEGGKKNGRVLGWITDSLLERFLTSKT